MKKLRILHITKDDKFFDGVFAAFETDERLENRAVLQVSKVQGYDFRRIQHPEKLQLVTRDTMRSILKAGEYDALFFHSLNLHQYEYVRWIPKDKIVIWWCWGFELYSSQGGMRPLIPLNLYQPLTAALLEEKEKGGTLKSIIKKYVLGPLHERQRSSFIRRVDYMQPVIPLEYQLMLSNKDFHAKEFYYPRSHSLCQVDTALCKEPDGNILVGNSQAPSNNHMDVWSAAEPSIPDGRKVIFPLNYLGNQNYASEITKRIHSTRHYLIFLREFMPRPDYFKLVDSCSYAIFGVMRQQAMGNIYHCLYQGIKVFLYRDSLIYKELKEFGYVVYAIEDIDEHSFSVPLTQKELEMNVKAIESQRDYVASVREISFNELLNMYIKKE